MSSLVAGLARGETLYSGWAGWTDALHAETLARAGFDAVTLDMQHGLHTIETMAACIGAVALAGKPAIVRIPLGDWGGATRALDMGAAAVIAPMINSAQDAKLFAAAMKYPPLGERSWGPQRAMQIAGVSSGPEFLGSANKNTLALAMIETREALAALDDILAVDGIDGVFVGPVDFSINWNNGAIAKPAGEIGTNPANDEINPALEDIAKRTKAAGKVRSIFCARGEAAQMYRDFGYQLMGVGWDPAYVMAGAKKLLDEVKLAE